MTASTRLYPLELFRLLEAMWDDSFSGSVVLRSRDETTTLYLSEGQVRYATTTEISGSFPGYLLTEELFSRGQIHTWLEQCSRAQLTLEEHLLNEKVLDPSAVVAMKTDMCQSIFARALSRPSRAELLPSRGQALLFGDSILNPYDALFQCVAEGHVFPHRVADLSAYLDRGPLARTAVFYRLWPLFRRWFDPIFVAPLFDAPKGLASLGGTKEERSLRLTYTYLFRETGMACFADEKPRPAEMSRPRVLSVPEPEPVEAPKATPLRREATVPGGLTAIAPSSMGDPLAPPPPANPSRRVSPRKAQVEVQALVDPSESFADLRGNLVGSELIEASELAHGANCYEFLGVRSSAALSEIRAAWQRMRRRYEDERYRALILGTEAKVALKGLQKRTEAAYDTLTDLRRRLDHDVRFAVPDALPKPVLEDVFYAEGLFKAAQIRLTEERYAEAAQLLDEAFIRNSLEPEYLSYLAFTLFTAKCASLRIDAGADDVDSLLSRAIAMNSRLESAWLFRARVLDQGGHASQAMGAYMTVLDIDGHNDEARRAVRAFKDAGVTPSGRLKRELAQRLGRLLGRRGSR